MGMCVCGGAMLQCTFGMAPSMLNVLPDKKTVNNMPVATIDCNKPMVNILPFDQSGGDCSSRFARAVCPAHPGALGARQPDSACGRSAGAQSDIKADVCLCRSYIRDKSGLYQHTDTVNSNVL